MESIKGASGVRLALVLLGVVIGVPIGTWLAWRER